MKKAVYIELITGRPVKLSLYNVVQFCTTHDVMNVVILLTVWNVVLE